MFLCSWFLLAGAHSLFGQDPQTGQYFFQRGIYGEPGYTGLEQAGYPPGYNPWPAISPYGPPVDQHYYHNGHWFRRIMTGDRKYYAGLEALITRTGAPPHALIGAGGVNVYTPESVNQEENGQPSTNNPLAAQHSQAFFEKVVVELNDTPERDFTNQGTSTGGAGTTADIQIFPTMNAGVLQQTIGSGGVRGTWGFWNPDGSGAQLQAYWQDKGTSSATFGDYPYYYDPNPDDLVLNPSIPLTTGISNRFIENFLTHTHPWFGLPLPGADRDGDGLPGVVVPYDVGVQFDYSTSFYGGNLDWYFSPIYDRDWFKIKPVAGARVLRLQELFAFTGIDSGMGYTLSQDPRLTSNNTGGGGGGGGTTGQATPSIPFLIIDQGAVDLQFDNPAPRFDQDNGYLGLITSHLQSRTSGVLAGPEVGLRLDLGGDKFKVWTQSKFGLFAYYSDRKVSGYNIGDHFNVIVDDPQSFDSTFNPSRLPLDPQTNSVPRNPLRAAGIEGSTFSNTQRNTTVSPMFEQGVFVEAPILAYVPGINKMSLFEKANFTAGYTVIVLGNIYRPTSDINWAQFPDFPTLNGNTDTFYTTNWSLGVNWNF